MLPGAKSRLLSEINDKTLSTLRDKIFGVENNNIPSPTVHRFVSENLYLSDTRVSEVEDVVNKMKDKNTNRTTHGGSDRWVDRMGKNITRRFRSRSIIMAIIIILLIVILFMAIKHFYTSGYVASNPVIYPNRLLYDNIDPHV